MPTWPPRHPTSLVAALGAFCALAWWLLASSDPPADWLRVEASPQPVLDQPFQVRATLLPVPHLALPTRLGVDLHWTSWNRTRGQVLLSGGSNEITSTNTAAVPFTFHLRDRPGLHAVFVVAFLSPTGKWADRTHVAVSSPLTISREPSSTHPPPALRPLALHLPEPTHPNLPRTTTPARLALAGLALAGAILAWHRRRRLPSALPSSAPPTDASAPSSPLAHAEVGSVRSSLTWIIALLAASALWDLFALGTALANTGRVVARNLGLYGLRQSAQHLLTALVIGATFTLLTALARSAHRQSLPQPLRWTVAALALLWTLHLAAALSLHSVDRFLFHPVAGLPLLDLLQATALTCALASLARVPPTH